LGCEIVLQQNRAEEWARDVLRYETARYGDYSRLWSGHRPCSLKNKSRTRLRESEKPGDADVRRIDFDFNKNAIVSQRAVARTIATARLGGRSFPLTRNAANVCALGRSRSWNPVVLVRQKISDPYRRIFFNTKKPSSGNFFQ
jgi:hypothetical protein